MILQSSQVDALEWAVTVTNTGVVAGKKTIMAFAGESGSRGSLWGLQKVELAPGASATLRFADATGWCPLCTVDERGMRAVRAGTHVVRFGGHGGDVADQDERAFASATVHVKGVTVPRPL